MSFHCRNYWCVALIIRHLSTSTTHVVYNTSWKYSIRIRYCVNNGRVTCKVLWAWEKTYVRTKIMKNFIAKLIISIFVKLRYWRLKLLKYKANNKKIRDTFVNNFKNMFSCIYDELGIIRKAIFCIIGWSPNFKVSKMALNPFCDETFHNYFLQY